MGQLLKIDVQKMLLCLNKSILCEFYPLADPLEKYFKSENKNFDSSYFLNFN